MSTGFITIARMKHLKKHYSDLMTKTTYEISFRNPTESRKSFVEAFILRGEDLVVAAEMYLRRETCAWLECQDKRGGRAGRKHYKEYAYLVINGMWFKEYLKKNRLIRDKYMSMIGALEEQGLTDEALAKVLKDDIDSKNDKIHINALNKVIDMKQADAKLNKDKRLDSSFQLTNEEKGQLEEANITALPEHNDDLVNEILEGVQNDLREVGSPRQVSEEESRIESSTPNWNTSVSSGRSDS